MIIRVIAFGIAREIFGKREIELDIDGPINAVQLKNRLSLLYPELKEILSFAIAVNQEYALPTTEINASDEIAIIPPVSGG